MTCPYQQRLEQLLAQVLQTAQQLYQKLLLRQSLVVRAAVCLSEADLPVRQAEACCHQK